MFLLVDLSKKLSFHLSTGASKNRCGSFQAQSVSLIDRVWEFWIFNNISTVWRMGGSWAKFYCFTQIEEVKNLKSGSSKNTLRSLLPFYERAENIQEFVLEPDEAYEWKGVPSSLQDFFPPSISFSKHVRNSTSEYSEQSLNFWRKKGEICSVSLISWVFVRDGSSFPFPILMLRIG